MVSMLDGHVCLAVGELREAEAVPSGSEVCDIVKSGRSMATAAHLDVAT